MDSDRFERGFAQLNELDAGAAERVVESVRDVAPEFGRLLIEFAYGDVYSRPALDLKTRELVTVAALAVLGTATPQLKVHVRGALNVGASAREIVEVLMQMAVYAGFPAALNGLFAAREVFQEKGEPLPPRP